jgi:hypothetical protein
VKFNVTLTHELDEQVAVSKANIIQFAGVTVVGHKLEAVGKRFPNGKLVQLVAP